jgi:hypothetical protein
MNIRENKMKRTGKNLRKESEERGADTKGYIAECK